MKDTPPNYTPVEIRMLPATEAGYPVELTVNQDQQFAGGYLIDAYNVDHDNALVLLADQLAAAKRE